MSCKPRHVLLCLLHSTATNWPNPIARRPVALSGTATLRFTSRHASLYFTGPSATCLIHPRPRSAVSAARARPLAHHQRRRRGQQPQAASFRLTPVLWMAAARHAPSAAALPGSRCPLTSVHRGRALASADRSPYPSSTAPLRLALRHASARFTHPTGATGVRQAPLTGTAGPTFERGPERSSRCLRRGSEPPRRSRPPDAPCRCSGRWRRWLPGLRMHR